MTSMRWYLLIPACVLLLLVPVVVLAGGDGGFDGVVSAIETRYNAHATRIPLMGLMSVVSGTATHGGMGNLHVAEFDNFTAQVDGNELDRMVEQKLGDGWERVIRETSRKGGEQTLILMRPEGARMGLFVLDLDGSELDVVQVSVDPDHLQDSIGKYSHHDHDSSD
ncbi:MAG TPA: hypothetical protein VE291_08760 [Terracidiphilus sp.]|jgi:hypothetical protein|nr:hypothetical protein [Terracidiphilus sp.]